MHPAARPRFTRPRGTTADESTSANLFVANCGPAVGVSPEDVASAFGEFGEVVAVHPADETGARTIVCFSEAFAAEAALQALNGRPCPALGGRVLHIRYSVSKPPQKIRGDVIPVCLSASELQIPGIYIVHDLISLKEEQELLEQVDSRPWKSLAKRRVQHYGYEFLYQVRNVDSNQFLGKLPSFVSHILNKIVCFPGSDDFEGKEVDQLTVNEYPCGVGLSPHIDTHSAFDEHIFSLSTVGSCIMEFRQYPEGSWCSRNEFEGGSNYNRKALYLPPRSMLLMSGEGRYAWHHYIPHHKVDVIGEQLVRRSSRRVSFTFRKVRKGPCCCQYKEYCDSQGEKN